MEYKPDTRYRFFYFDSSNFRTLMAGGGTGTMALYMSESLNDTNAEIVYIDFSKTSLSISKRRAKYRNIANIIWINDWLEDVKRLGLGVIG